MTYAFQLGREPLLSVLELISVYPTEEPHIVDDVVIYSSLKDAEKNFSRLGGTIKIGRYVHSVPAERFIDAPEAAVIAAVSTCASDDFSGSFAINFFGSAPSSIRKQKKQIAIRAKKEMRNTFSHVRYVESDARQTSSVTVRRNKLLRGADLWFVFDGDQVHVFTTIDVQQYQAFSERDFGRPRRDARNGMLPPKLARIMLNIAGIDNASVVYDPFVGSGTVLQEAALLGAKKVYGSDVSTYAVDATEANLEWLEKTTNRSILYSLQTQDVATLDPQSYQDVTHIVAELDLGEPLRARATKQEAASYGSEAHDLLVACLRFADQLPSLATMVLALPFWRGSTEHFFVTRPDFGSLRLDALPQFLQSQFKEEISPGGGVLYARDSQFVGREIIRLVRT